MSEKVNVIETDDRLDEIAARIREAELLGSARGIKIPVRQKTWGELTQDERIERLRECVRSKDMAIRDLREQVARLMNHSHGTHGELLGPLFTFSGEAGISLHRYDPLA